MSKFTEQFCYLISTGRKTGQPREIEIWFVEADGHLYILAEHGLKAQWVQNVIKSPTVDVRIGDRHYTGTARVLHRAKDADVYIKAQEIARQKYGWGEGLPVEIVLDV